jgi:hypothetical protein
MLIGGTLFLSSSSVQTEVLVSLGGFRNTELRKYFGSKKWEKLEEYDKI